MALLLLTACALLSTFPCIHKAGWILSARASGIFTSNSPSRGDTRHAHSALLRLVVYFDAENKAHSDIKNPYC